MERRQKTPSNISTHPHVDGSRGTNMRDSAAGIMLSFVLELINVLASSMADSFSKKALVWDAMLLKSTKSPWSVWATSLVVPL